MLGPEDLASDPTHTANGESVPAVSAVEPEVQLEQVREYRLLGKLGQGGMGTVYRAEHWRLGRIVVLKVLHCRRSRSPGPCRPVSAQKMKAGGTLDHPNIVRATDAGEWQGTEYLVMEFVDGMDAGNLVRRLGPISVADACEIVRRRRSAWHMPIPMGWCTAT